MTHFRIPDAILAQHTAILGKTGSGKTTTGKVCIEQVVDEDYRVCIIDPVKSDWWGLTSSADGKRAGLPFTILGGPHGHVPLHHTSGKAIADVVANGSLRLSILDMANFPPGGAQHFFVDFIPRLMQKMKGVLYLVIEEAHEFAPKERAGFGKENMSIHYAKSVATGGRSRGIRLIVLDQRVQALHNAVLGSCETTIVHRMTQPADQEPVVKWMKANVKDKALREQITDSMSKLKTGTGWVCSGEAEIFSLLEFPKARTFDNSKTPDKDDDVVSVKTAQVDVESLKGIIGEAVKEAEANDPVLLRKRLEEMDAKLVRALARQNEGREALAAHILNEPFKQPACLIDHDGYARAAREQGFADGVKTAQEAAIPRFDAFVESTYMRIRDSIADLFSQRPDFTLPSVAIPADYMKDFPRRTVAEQHDGIALRSTAHPPAPKGTKLPLPRLNPKSLETIEIEMKLGEAEIRFLTVLAQRAGRTVTRDQLAIFAGYPVKSRHTDNKLAVLRRAGLVEGPGDDIRITQKGLNELGPFEELPTGRQLREFWLAKLEKEGEKRILSHVTSIYPETLTRDQLAAAVGYPVESRHTDNLLAKLRSFGLIVGPGSAIKASEELF